MAFTGTQQRVFYLMLSSSLLFAVGNTFVKLLKGFHPYQLVFFRSVVSISITYFQIKKLGISIWGNNKKILIIRGLSGTIALALFFYLLQNVNFGTAVTLQYLSPIFTAIIGIFLLQEKVNFWQWISMLICFVGVIILQNADIKLDIYFTIIGLLTAALAGLAYNCIRISRLSDHHLLSVFYFPLIAIPLSGLSSIPHWINPSGWDFVYIAGLGIVTQIAQIFMSEALQSDKVSNVSVYQYLGSIFAVVIGWLFFNEIPSIHLIMGIVVILVGLILFFKIKNLS
jgi:drug/metabolite transporter (DMT)-like permease